MKRSIIYTRYHQFFITDQVLNIHNPKMLHTVRAHTPGDEYFRVFEHLLMTCGYGWTAHIIFRRNQPSLPSSSIIVNFFSLHSWFLILDFSLFSFANQLLWYCKFKIVLFIVRPSMRRVTAKRDMIMIKLFLCHPKKRKRFPRVLHM